MAVTIATSESGTRRRVHIHFVWSVAVLSHDLAYEVHSFHQVYHSVLKTDHAPI